MKTGAKLQQLRHDLRDAAKGIEQMKEAPTFEAADRAWRHFLDGIGKVANKLLNLFDSEPSIFEDTSYRQTWKAHPVLQYVRVAWNSDKHAFVDHAMVQRGSYSAMIGGPGMVGHGEGVFVSRLIISAGRVTEYRGSHPIRIFDEPSRLVLVPLQDDKGRTAWASG